MVQRLFQQHGQRPPASFHSQIQPDMNISKLAHYSIRTTDLPASLKFYTEVIGLRNGWRPPFKFPGHWLYLDEKDGIEGDQGSVHLIGVDPVDPSGLIEAMGDKDIESLHGSGAVDHVAFFALNREEVRENLTRLGVPYRERTVPTLKVHQIFLEDPSGLVVELNIPFLDDDEGADS